MKTPNVMQTPLNNCHIWQSRSRYGNLFPDMEMACFPYLGIFCNDAIVEFQLAYRGLFQVPDFPLPVPDAAGSFYLAAQFGLAQADANGDRRRQGRSSTTSSTVVRRRPRARSSR